MNYSDKEKEAINNLNFIVVTDIYDNEVNIDKTKIINEYNQSVGTVLNLIQKQDKIIDKMAEQFYSLYKNIEVVRDSFDMPFGKFLKSKEELIEYFKKVVDEDVKD